MFITVATFRMHCYLCEEGIWLRPVTFDLLKHKPQIMK